MLKTIDFESLKLTISNARSDRQEYELLRTERGASAAYYCGFWHIRDDVSREDCLIKRVEGGDELYGEICALLQNCKVASWDGFNKGNKYVLDGKQFTLDAIINGSKIHASGENNFPKTYRDFLAAIREIIDRDENKDEI